MGQYCAACLAYSGKPLCQSCLERITLPEYRCRVCGFRLLAADADGRCKDCIERPPAFEALYNIGTYKTPLSDLIIAAKITRKSAAVAALRDLLQHYLRHDAATNDYFAQYHDYSLLAMPTPKSRLMQRGFNLPRWFAEDISCYYGLPLLSSRTVTLPLFVPKQAALSKQQRQKNRHFYQINHKLPDKILIIDDIFTTGATLNELAKQLRRNHAKSVAAYTIARSQFAAE